MCQEGNHRFAHHFYGEKGQLLAELQAQDDILLTFCRRIWKFPATSVLKGIAKILIW